MEPLTVKHQTYSGLLRWGHVHRPPFRPVRSADPIALDAQLDDEERLIRSTVRQYVRGSSCRWWRALRGGSLPDGTGRGTRRARSCWACTWRGTVAPGSSATAYGLICLELERGRLRASGRSSRCRGSLVMFAIWALGSRGAEAALAAGDGGGARDRLLRPGRAGRSGSTPSGCWRAPCARAAATGCSAAPRCGSPTARWRTWRVVWARSEEGVVRGFLVPKGTPGFTAPVMRGKLVAAGDR